MVLPCISAVPVIPYPKRREGIKYFKHIGVYAFSGGFVNFAKLPMKPWKLLKNRMSPLSEYGMKIKMIETNFVGVGDGCSRGFEKKQEKF